MPQTVHRLGTYLNAPRAASGLSDMAAEVLAKQHRFILVSDLDWTMVMPISVPNLHAACRLLLDMHENARKQHQHLKGGSLHPPGRP